MKRTIWIAALVLAFSLVRTLPASAQLQLVKAGFDAAKVAEGAQLLRGASLVGPAVSYQTGVETVASLVSDSDAVVELARAAQADALNWEHPLLQDAKVRRLLQDPAFTNSIVKSRLARNPCASSMPTQAVNATLDAIEDAARLAALDRLGGRLLRPDDALQSTLKRYISERRWFGGKADGIRSVEVRDVVPVPTGDGPAYLTLVDVTLGSGRTDLYVLPLMEVSESAGVPSVGVVEKLGGGQLLVDASLNPAFPDALLATLGSGQKLPTLQGGKLVASKTNQYNQLRGRALGAEQSNTSVLFSGLMMKLFRRPAMGLNPDVEVGSFLTEVGFQATPPAAGSIDLITAAGERRTISFVQGFVPNEGDAWEHTLETVAKATEGAPDAPELLDPVRLLAKRTAEMHKALGSETSAASFAREPFTGEDVDTLVDSLSGLRDTLKKLRTSQLEGESADLAARVLALEDALFAKIEALRSLDVGTAIKVRTHGDYHLGQVLRTPEGDYKIIDFEGEPARTLEERRAKHSPLKDVAGMLRSYDYVAAQTQSLGRAGAEWTSSYSKAAQNAFLETYLKEMEGTGLIPDGEAGRELLDLYLLDKTIYELAYELNNRPDWVGIPLRALERLAETGETASRLGELDAHLFNEGTATRAYEFLGSHPDEAGTHFSVWAPNADEVSVIGSFNGWDAGAHPMRRVGNTGIWEGFVPGAKDGDLYKYRIANGDQVLEKADPYAYQHEVPPRTASVVRDLKFEWGDQSWMAQRAGRGAEDPVSIYEVHWGSWRRGADGELLDAPEQARQLAAYAKEMGFTHVELMPITHHPFAPSWGYQTTGMFAPTSQWFRTPEEFATVVDELHKEGVGVIVDWVPAHFPTAKANPEGLGQFDGTHLYEHADPRRGFHPDWNTSIPNYGRNEVRSYYASSASFWLDKYHVDGLRVDGVASMLYNSYSRGERMGVDWIPSRYNGVDYKENIDAVRMLRQVNAAVHEQYPGVLTIAEESTAFPGVTKPPMPEGETFDVTGLGFDLKWNMGWMHDTLEYLSKDPVYRRWEQDAFTKRYTWQHSEGFAASLSHDEVVYGKGSLLEKMPGDDWQKFANLRVLYGLQWGEPGKKLLFMGQEFAQRSEWAFQQSLDWHLLGDAKHEGVQRLVRDLNELYRTEPALQQDLNPAGFQMISSDSENSVVAFVREGTNSEQMLVVANMTPVPRNNYRVGVPSAGNWNEVLNTDASIYGGSNVGNLGTVRSNPTPTHGQRQSVNLTLPPLSVSYFKLEVPK